MYSACVTEVDEKLKENLLKSLEFIVWKNQVERDSKVFLKPNFTFPYYKEGEYGDVLVMKEFDEDHGVIYVEGFVGKYNWDDIVSDFEGYWRT